MNMTMKAVVLSATILLLGTLGGLSQPLRQTQGAV
jgi:hypothetical protein